jgi:hypothetical protein
MYECIKCAARDTEQFIECTTLEILVIKTYQWFTLLNDVLHKSEEGIFR